MSAPGAGSGTAAAYEVCEAITREQAANFYYGIRLLPRERRRAMCAAYAFARRVDDIGDGTLEPAEKLRRLEEQAATLAAVGAPGTGPVGDDPVLVALADAEARFALPLGALGELIEGVRMDVRGVTYERFEDLVPYCRRVAGSIGRVCLAIFGVRRGRPNDRTGADALADDLGVALQLTNILRDVREDAEHGRVYLPAQELRRFGLDGAEAPQAQRLLGWLADGEDGPEELVRYQAERAREWFDRGLELVPLLDRRSAACVLAMAGIYRRVLERIERDPRGALERRVSLTAREKVWVAGRAMLAGGR